MKFFFEVSWSSPPCASTSLSSTGSGKIAGRMLLFPETDLMRNKTTNSDLLFWGIDSSSSSRAFLRKFELFAFMGEANMVIRNAEINNLCAKHTFKSRQRSPAEISKPNNKAIYGRMMTFAFGSASPEIARGMLEFQRVVSRWDPLSGWSKRWFKSKIRGALKAAS